MTEVDFVKIGYRLRRERLSQNLSQAALAELSGLSTNYISHIERATTKLSIQSLVCLCNALRVSTDQILMDNLVDNHLLLSNDIAKLVKDLDASEMVLVSELCRAVLRARGLTEKE